MGFSSGPRVSPDTPERTGSWRWLGPGSRRPDAIGAEGGKTMELKPLRTHFVALAFLLAACAPADGPAQKGLPGPPGEQEVCAVCGMTVASYPDWVAQAVFDDGTTAFFDGSKDLFRYLLARDRYLPDKRNLQITAIYVTDYYELRPIEARDAFFVLGSDVHGPMGNELVPLASMGAAQEFERDHGGARIVRFEEVTRELLSTLG